MDKDILWVAEEDRERSVTMEGDDFDIRTIFKGRRLVEGNWFIIKGKEDND